VRITVRDPGLGIVPPGGGRTQVKIGVCSKGTPNTVYTFGAVKAAVDALGSGSLLDAVVQALSVAGGPVMAVPVTVAYGNFGAAPGALALSGSGTGTVTASRGAGEAIQVKIILGGTLTTATFQTKVGTGGWSPTVTTGAGPFHYLVPGAAFTDLVFAAGTYVTGDVFLMGVNGLVTRTGTGTATLLDGSTSSPVDGYEIWVQVTAAGALGAASFRYSLDGGNTFSSPIMVPLSGVYPIVGTGLVLTFAGTFNVDDIYRASALGPGFVTGDVATAMDALLADPAPWGWVHVVGMPTTAAGALAMAGTVDAKMTTAQTAFRYAWGAIECPQTEVTADIKALFVNFQSARVGVYIGDVGLVSPLTGRTNRRNNAWPVLARLGGLGLSIDPAQVDLGALRNVTSIYRNEAATPEFDDARFNTVRTHVGLPGYYVTAFRMMAAPGSDFTWGTNRRVIDRVCEVARQGYLLFLNRSTRLDPVTGFIDERDAQMMDALVTAKERAAVLATGDVTDVTAQLSRTDNLLSTGLANAEVSAIPKGYFRAIDVVVGLTNPALQAAA
jgi:hypothetical protein